MVEKYTQKNETAPNPETGLRAMKGFAQFDAKKSGTENLNALVKAVTRNGVPLHEDEKLALKSIIKDNDAKGYFSDAPTGDVAATRGNTYGVQIEKGLVRFYDAKGAPNMGSFPLAEYRSDSMAKTPDTPKDHEAVARAVESAENDMKVAMQRRRLGLSMLVEQVSKNTRGFQKMESGAYEIGSSEVPTRIKESGLDFYKLTHAEHITLNITKQNSDAPELRSAHWVAEKNNYEYDDSKGEKVTLWNNTHYELTPTDPDSVTNTPRSTGVDYSRRSFDSSDAKTEAAKRKVMGIPDEQVSREKAERVLDRSKRFVFNFENFLTKYYAQISNSIITQAGPGEWRPKEVLRYEYGRPVFDTTGQNNQYFNAPLEDGSSVKLLQKTPDSSVSRVRLDGRGTYIVETHTNGDFSVSLDSKVSNPFFSFNAAQEKVEGDFDAFTAFADHAGEQIARTVNDFNDPQGYWKREERRRKRDQQPDSGLNS